MVRCLRPSETTSWIQASSITAFGDHLETAHRNPYHAEYTAKAEPRPILGIGVTVARLPLEQLV